MLLLHFSHVRVVIINQLCTIYFLSVFQDKLLTKLDEHEPEIANNEDEEVCDLCWK